MDNLDRFMEAQKRVFTIALKEIKNGKKESHWIWFIFPQLKELCQSKTSLYYGINGLEEATEYLNNPYLRKNLITITKTLLELDSNDPTLILGYPDNLKVRSCMTLFYYVDNSISVFKEVIDKYYNGEFDEVTLDILNNNYTKNR